MIHPMIQWSGQSACLRRSGCCGLCSTLCNAVQPLQGTLATSSQALYPRPGRTSKRSESFIHCSRQKQSFRKIIQFIAYKGNQAVLCSRKSGNHPTHPHYEFSPVTNTKWYQTEKVITIHSAPAPATTSFFSPSETLSPGYNTRSSFSLPLRRRRPFLTNSPTPGGTF